MRYPNEGEPSPPPLIWIEDEQTVEDALRDVVVPHEGERKEEEPDGGDGADGDSSRHRRGRAA